MGYMHFEKEKNSDCKLIFNLEVKTNKTLPTSVWKMKLDKFWLNPQND